MLRTRKIRPRNPVVDNHSATIDGSKKKKKKLDKLPSVKDRGQTDHVTIFANPNSDPRP